MPDSGGNAVDQRSLATLDLAAFAQIGRGERVDVQGFSDAT
jgi:hypothetical protein